MKTLLMLWVQLYYFRLYDYFCIILVLLLFIYSLQIISPQSPISLDDVELVIEGDIENDEYITNASKTIKKYYN